MSLSLKALVGLFLLVAAPASAEDVAAKGLAQRVDVAIDAAIAQKRLVGAVVLIARDGELVYHRAAGLADRDTGRAMTEDAIFRLSSVTKPIVTAAAMRLVEQGRVGLDDPVARWLPYFRPAFNGKEPPILIRHLLTHTAGLSYGLMEKGDGPYHKAGISDGLDKSGLTLDENLRRIASVPLAYESGEGWRYSVAIDVLGGVIEKATGKDLASAVGELVIEELRLGDTGFVVTDTARLATAYADGKPEPTSIHDGDVVPVGEGGVLFAPSRILDPAAFPSGGAGMAGTAGDVLAFLEAVRKGGAPILSDATVATMMTDQTGPQAQTQGPGWGFGFGWAVLSDPGLAGTPQSKGTIQWGGVYGHNWFVDPAAKLTVVALTNTGPEGMWGQFARDLRAAVYDND